MGITESALRDTIHEYLLTLQKQKTCWFAKILGNAMQKGGIPDFLICYKGRFVALELKKPEDSYGLTGRQRIELKRINTAGGVGLEVTSLEQVKELIKALDNNI